VTPSDREKSQDSVRCRTERALCRADQPVAKNVPNTSQLIRQAQPSLLRMNASLGRNLQADSRQPRRAAASMVTRCGRYGLDGGISSAHKRESRLSGPSPPCPAASQAGARTTRTNLRPWPLVDDAGHVEVPVVVEPVGPGRMGPSLGAAILTRRRVGRRQIDAAPGRDHLTNGGGSFGGRQRRLVILAKVAREASRSISPRATATP
jgi:hypothetical protein